MSTKPLTLNILKIKPNIVAGMKKAIVHAEPTKVER